MLHSLVEEVPAYSEAEHTLVEWVVGGEEIVLVARAGVDVTHHHEEAGVLDVYVGIGIDDWVVAHLYVLVAIALHGVGSHVW